MAAIRAFVYRSIEAWLKVFPMHLVIHGHPNPESYSEALANAYSRGLVEKGAEVEHLVLRDLVFDPILRLGFSGKQKLEPDLVRAQAALSRASHVTWFFPTWWGSPATLVRGFVDRVFLPGFAFKHRGNGNGLPDALLAGRTSRVVTTMDSPNVWYWFFHRSAVHASFVNATLRYVGFSSIEKTTIFGLRMQSEKSRRLWLEKLEEAGRKDATLKARVRAFPPAFAPVS